jgi:hypothetical protein
MILSRFLIPHTSKTTLFTILLASFVPLWL